MWGRVSARLASLRSPSGSVIAGVIGVGVIVPAGVVHHIRSQKDYWIAERLKAIHNKDVNELTSVLQKHHTLIRSPLNQVFHCYPDLTEQDWDDLESLVTREGGGRRAVEGYRNLQGLRSRFGVPASQKVNWNALDWAVIHGNADLIFQIVYQSRHLFESDPNSQSKQERQTWQRLVSHPAVKELTEPLIKSITFGSTSFAKLRSRVLGAACIMGIGDSSMYSAWTEPEATSDDIPILQHIVANGATLPTIIRASSFLHSIRADKKGAEKLKQHHEAIVESLIRQSRLDIIQTIAEKNDDSLFPPRLLYDSSVRMKWIKLSMERNQNLMTAFFLQVVAPSLSSNESQEVVTGLYHKDQDHQHQENYDWLRLFSPHLQTECKKLGSTWRCDKLLKALYSMDETAVSKVMFTQPATEVQVLEDANIILQDLDLTTRYHVLTDIRERFHQLRGAEGSQTVAMTSKAKESTTWKKGTRFYDVNILSVNKNGEFIFQYANKPGGVESKSGGSANSTTPTKFHSKQEVRARWKQGTVWYPATIVSVNKDQTYIVQYADGDIDSLCPETSILKRG